MKWDTQMMKRIAGRSTAGLMLVVLLAAGVAAGPAMVKDIRLDGMAIPSGPAGSLPVVVDWSLIIGRDNPRDVEQVKKYASRARRADGTAGVSSRSCSAVTQ